ncbi:MAG: excinuclease ABC subunit UvrA, partial [Bacteroidia bacterium]|nr:excinuclease ABC subunit UvrA [Bacteroidia bacterium]
VEDKALARLTQSVATTLNLGKGSLLALAMDAELAEPVWFTRFLMDPVTGISYDEPAPNNFSFNSPYGACPTCSGLGRVLNLNPESTVPHPERSILKGALAPLEDTHMGPLEEAVRSAFKAAKQKTSTPWQDLPEEFRNLLLTGDPELSASQLDRIEIDQTHISGRFVGLAAYLRTRFLHTGSDQVRATAEQYLQEDVCPTCNGARLKQESLFFRIDGQNISQLARLDLDALLAWFEGIEDRLSDRQRLIAAELLKEIRKRLGFLLDVGLGYLSLDRPARSLSGGEAQRIRLATQIGSQLMGVLYILDEPSIGLHQRDNQRLIRSLHNLRDLGNTVLVVEHDKDMMLASDYLVDIGPGAGFHGGRVVAEGPPAQFLLQASVTAEYLDGRRRIPIPAQRRKPGKAKLTLKGCTGHNLKHVTLEVPLGLFVCVSGVSGSGKSSLINQTLFPLLHQHAFGFKRATLPYESVKGLEHLDKVIEIDQKPIGRTPRSNPATYTGLFTFIRELFTELPESKIRGYQPGRFSFNVKGGRCETCGGAGLQTLEMNFLPDVYVTCPTCRGKRYNRETLEVRYKGRSIADVLNMTVEDALGFFEALPRICQKIQALYDVGLGYIQLGQAATTLSGGEAQRMKIATELSKRDTGRTFYILDEPTTGLHFQDIEKLLQVLNLLVEKGNTVLVIEHNLDVIAYADWVIDLGPEGGSGGGEIIATGPPEVVAGVKRSHTGRFLKTELGLA